MRRLIFALLLLAVAPVFAAEQPKLAVHVRNQVGFLIRDLKADDFVVTQDKMRRPVTQAAWISDEVVDIVLLLETSEIGKQLHGEIENAAGMFIKQLGEKQQMAIIGYGSSADLVQDLTDNKTLLRRAIGTLKYGNPPSLLDGVFAAIDGGFEHAAGRRILVVIGSGLDARDKVTRKEVLQLAERNGVSIYGIAFADDFELNRLADQSAGDCYQGRQLKQIGQVVENVAASFRGHYELTLPGPALDSGKLKVEVKRDERPRISYRAMN